MKFLLPNKAFEGVGMVRSSANEGEYPINGSVRHRELSTGDLQTCIDDSQALKCVSRDLGHLKENLDAFIEKCCNEILPVARHHGFTSLANVITLLILKQVFASYKDAFQGARVIIRDLSMVSRTLRGIVLQFSEVWTYLDLNVCGAESLDLLLLRCGNRPLSVRFKYSAGTQKNILHALGLPSRNRWTYLSADFSFEHLNRIEKPPAMSFPALKTLHAYASDNDFHWLFPDWTFPNAEIIEVEDNVLRPHHFSYESLKTFHYTSQFGDVGISRTFLRKLTDFLRPFASLSTLYLDISFVGDIDDPALFFEIELPNVKSFTISNWRSNPEQEYHEEDNPLYIEEFTRIVSTMKIPNVQAICICYAFSDDSICLEDLLFNASPPSHVSESLTCLSCNIQRFSFLGDDEHTIIYVGDFFRHFPTLQRLNVDTGDCDVAFLEDPEIDLRGLENLQSFRIKFDGESREQLYGLLESMSEKKAPLKEIDVLSTYNLDEEKILGKCSRQPTFISRCIDSGRSSMPLSTSRTLASNALTWSFQ
ncbi:hypothetical protein ACEPAI_5701 [Sanghuangporus weigelae]